MKKLLLVFIAALFVFTSFKEKKISTEKNITATKLYLEYSAPTKKIIINNNILLLTETIEEYDNPVSAVPSKKTEVNKKAILTQASLDELNKLIKSNGFMNLKKNAYGAGESDRYYPYSILVKSGKKEKKIIYRSNPSSESAPKEFNQIEQALNDLVKNVKKWE